MAGGIDTEMSRLRHKDIRQRRRAIRVLFDADIPRALEAFAPLLSDDDQWFRSKALEAYRKWSKANGVTSLQPLLKSDWNEAKRCAANLLSQFDNATDEAKSLLESDDKVSKRIALTYLLSLDGNDEIAKQYANDQDPAIRAIVAESDSTESDLRDVLLKDQNSMVSSAAFKASLSAGDSFTSEQVLNLLESGVNPEDLVKPALDVGDKAMVSVCQALSKPKLKFLVKEMDNVIKSTEDERIQTLISNDLKIPVARWLSRKMTPECDVLRWQFIEDESFDVIERSKLLERLISRASEPEIHEKATSFAQSTADALLKLAAENLSTAGAELGL